MNDQQSGRPRPAPHPHPQGIDPSLLVAGPFTVAMRNRGTSPLPTQALVFSAADGTVAELSQVPSALGARKYRYRYEVDTGDHRSTWTDVLPSGTGGYGFQAVLDATWKVTAPGLVVQRNIRTVADGEAAVTLAVRNLLWPHAGLHTIDRLGDLDVFVRSHVCTAAHTLPEGLTVSSLTVGLTLDKEAVDHLRALRQAAEKQRLIEAEYRTDRTKQTLDGELHKQREEAIREASRGDGGLLVHLIAQDPTRLREIMLDLGQRQDMATERKMKTLQDLIDAKLIQPAEAQQMWHDMHGTAPLFGQDRSGPALNGPAPAAQLTAGAFQPAPPGPAAPAPGGGQAAPPPGPQAQVAGHVVLGSAQNPAPPKPRVRSFEQPAPGARPETPPPPQAPAAPPEPPARQEDTGGGSNVVGTTPVGPNRRPRRDGSGT